MVARNWKVDWKSAIDRAVGEMMRVLCVGGKAIIISLLWGWDELPEGVTERLEDIFEGSAKLAGRSVEEAKRSQVEKSGIRRQGRPEDVAVSVDGGATTGVY